MHSLWSCNCSYPVCFRRIGGAAAAIKSAQRWLRRWHQLWQLACSLMLYLLCWWWLFNVRVATEAVQVIGSYIASSKVNILTGFQVSNVGTPMCCSSCEAVSFRACHYLTLATPTCSSGMLQTGFRVEGLGRFREKSSAKSPRAKPCSRIMPL